jgi:hypothetical protein
MSYLIKIKTGVGGYGADGVKCYFGKGGGDSGAREATAEEKRLWAAQGAALEGMTKLSLPMLETGMNNLGVMANESQDGTLASRLRGLAGADASAAMGQGLTGATQKLERYGSTMNPNALGAQMNNAALQGAAMKSSAMNQANMGAEDLKWSRNAALTGLASGQGNSAVSGMGSLAGQIGQNRQMNMQADNQAMQGLGMAGAWAGSKMFADGGEVKGSHFKNGEWYLNGGTPSLRSYMPQSGSFQPWEISESDGYQGPSSLQQIGAVATPIAMMAGADAAKPYVTEAVKGLFSSAPTSASGAGLTASGTGVTSGTLGSGISGLSASGGTSGLSAGSSSVGLQALPATSTTTGATGANVVADTIGSTVATEAGGSSLMSGLGAAAPWLIGGLALASILDLKDGGSVAQGLKRKDMTKGGEVDGPGTSVSDSIPARLSDGEFVLNEGAVKMLGVDKLDALNQEGLKYRSEEPRMAPTASAEPHLAGGGFLHGLGMAAQGFVPTMMKLDEQKDQKARWEAEQAERTRQFNENIGLQKDQFGLQKETHAAQMDQIARGKKKEDDRAAVHKQFGSAIAQFKKGDYSKAGDFINLYNGNQGAFNDNRVATFSMGPDGYGDVGYYDAKTMKHLGNERYDQNQLLQMANDMYMARLAEIDAPTYTQQMDLGIKQGTLSNEREKTGIDRKYKLEVVPQLNRDDNAAALQRVITAAATRGGGGVVQDRTAQREAVISDLAESFLATKKAKSPEEARLMAQQVYHKANLGKLGLGQQGPALSFKDYVTSYGSGNAAKDMQGYQGFMLTTLDDEQLAQKLGAIPQGGGKPPPVSEPKAPGGLTLREHYERIVPPGGGTREIPMEDVKRFFRYGLSGRPPFSPQNP